MHCQSDLQSERRRNHFWILSGILSVGFRKILHLDIKTPKVFSIFLRALKSRKLKFFVICLPASGRINQCFSGKISSPTRRNDNSLVKSFLEQELKRNLFQIFFPFSSLTKCQHHCCSHLAQHLLLKNYNEHCILQAKPC